MPASSVSSLTDNSTWKCSTCKTFTCALVGTCLLKHSETPSGWGALPLFFLAQRGNKGSRSNQIRHSTIHQSIGFASWEVLPANTWEQSNLQFHIVTAWRIKHQLLSGVIAHWEIYRSGLTSPEGILYFFFGEADQLDTICAERATEVDIIISLKSVWNICLFIWEGHILHMYLDVCNPNLCFMWI